MRKNIRIAVKSRKWQSIIWILQEVRKKHLFLQSHLQMTEWSLKSIWFEMTLQSI